MTVNGVSFDTPEFFKSLKEAQNAVAQRAVVQFTSLEPFLPEPFKHSSASSLSAGSSGNTKQITGVKGMQRPYKNQLQSYAQKRNFPLPTYSCVREGPDHVSRFKSKVTIDGQTFESLEYFSTLKEAEHAAAETALKSLLPHGVQEDDNVFYKNLLQELAQKEGFDFPVYSTNTSGLSHMPTFVTTVETGGEFFTGDEANTKKQAEMSAAKVAYVTLKERKTNWSSQMGSSSSLQSISRVDLQENMTPKTEMALSSDIVPEDAQEDSGKGNSSEAEDDGSITFDSSSNMATNEELGGISSSAMTKKVIVCPYNPDMEVPPDATISDDYRWVAFRSDDLGG